MRVLRPSGDDWVVRVTSSYLGFRKVQWFGVSDNTPEEDAIEFAIAHVRTAKRIKNGTAPRIIDVAIAPMSAWRARALVRDCRTKVGQQVIEWSK